MMPDGGRRGGGKRLEGEEDENEEKARGGGEGERRREDGRAEDGIGVERVMVDAEWDDGRVSVESGPQVATERGGRRLVWCGNRS